MDLHRVQQLRQELPGLCASPHSLDLLEECLDSLEVLLRSSTSAPGIMVPREEYVALVRLHTSVEAARRGPWQVGHSRFSDIARASVRVSAAINNVRGAADGAEDKCPGCNQPLLTESWVYPRLWMCGTSLEEWKQGHGATDPVPVRSQACLIIQNLTLERDAAASRSKP